MDRGAWWATVYTVTKSETPAFTFRYDKMNLIHLPLLFSWCLQPSFSLSCNRTFLSSMSSTLPVHQPSPGVWDSYVTRTPQKAILAIR